MDAPALVRDLIDRHLTVGTAESLTGGLVCAALTEVPGASAVVGGAVVAYATDVKGAILGVDGALLQKRGAVDPEVVLAMARGVCRVLPCDVGLATTGVAGPTPQDPRPVGTVYLAVSGQGCDLVKELSLEGDRSRIRADSVTAALDLLRDWLSGSTPPA